VVFPGDRPRRRTVVNLAAPAVPFPPTVPEPALAQDAAAFLEWLFSQASLDVSCYRRETLRRRLPACLRLLRVRTPTQARHLLEGEPALIPTAMSAMLVGVTSFFRDPALFEWLGRELLPGMAQKRGRLNVWSAGCSDGCELYSVALLLAELGHLEGGYLLGTDCRPDAIAQARLGAYSPAQLRNVPPPLWERYFTATAGGWQVVREIRTALRWRTADLLRTQEPGLWDLILCRNTTMYMRAEAAQPLWERLEAGLRPGGLLVLGKAEQPLGVKRLALVAPCVYRRLRG
jgi:chemotaxis methyl-accepting protein methylase